MSNKHVNRPAGPSGEPVLHFVMCDSRGSAKNRAEEAGKGLLDKKICFQFF